VNGSSAPARAPFGSRFRATADWRGFGLATIAAVLLETLRLFDLAAQSIPPGAFLAACWSVWLLVAVTTAAVHGRETSSAIWIASFVEIFGIGCLLYMTGWGPTLAIGYAAGAADRLSVYGSRATNSLMVSSACSIALGQLAIATGLAPSYIASPGVQGLGAMALVGVLIVQVMMGDQYRRREAADSHARHSDEWFRALVQYASDAVVVFESNGAVKYASPAFERLLGHTSTDRLNVDLIHPDDRDAFIGRVAAVEAQGHAWVEIRARHADGTYHTLEVGISNLTDTSSISGYVANVRDVTERRLFEEQLNYQANHDPLTQLPNRRQFLDRLEHALTRAASLRTLVAVVFLDVDQFKVVNDSLGHEAGDRLLIEIATRLRSSLRPDDVVARFGGDEFTILLEDIGSSVDAIVVAERILGALREPFVVGGRDLHARASIGIAVSDAAADSTDSGELLREADLAMYLAKDRGRDRWELFDSRTAPGMIERLEIESGLRRAIDEDQLVVHYQPEIALAAHDVIAVEALVRWQHPQRGLLLPGAFINFAESGPLIVDIDRYVLRQAMRQVATWNRDAASTRAIRVSVNLSPRFLQQADAGEQIGALLDETECEPGWLQVEVTERTTLEEDAHAIDVLHALRSAGVAIAIDDFGTGYSALAYLRDLPVDVLKLDQSFIAGIGSNTHSAIIAAVITMGHALGVRVTAEGVEYGSQLVELRALGCDAAQGFHFAPAVPPEELPDTIARIRGERRPAADVETIPTEAAS